MAAYYLDTSAIVKRYALEQGTDWLLALVASDEGHDLYTVRLSGPEMISARYRKERTGQVASEEARRAVRDFRADWLQHYWIVEVTAEVSDKAMDLAERHYLRGYDAVHLAAALALHEVRQGLMLPDLTFLSADTDQLQAALSEGLRAENPATAQS